MSEESEFIMPFGKHKGEGIETIPDDYLKWLLTQVWFGMKHKDGADAVHAELVYRKRIKSG